MDRLGWEIWNFGEWAGWGKEPSAQRIACALAQKPGIFFFPLGGVSITEQFREGGGGSVWINGSRATVGSQLAVGFGSVPVLEGDVGF